MTRLQRLILIIGALVMLLIFVDWVSTSPERIPCGYRCLSYDYHISKLIGGILGTGAVTALLYFAFSSNKNKELDSNNLQTKHKHKIFDFSKRRSLISSIIISLLIYFGICLAVLMAMIVPGLFLQPSGMDPYSWGRTLRSMVDEISIPNMVYTRFSTLFNLAAFLPKVILVLLVGLIGEKRGYTSLKNYLFLIVIFFFPIISLIYLPLILSKDSNAKLDN